MKLNDSLLLVLNLGLGDAIVMNAAIRQMANLYRLVCVPVKYHNVTSVQFMLRDLPNVVIRPVENHDDQLFFANNVWKGRIIWTGISGPEWSDTDWDQVMYRQARCEFQTRWTHWKCDRQTRTEEPFFQPGSYCNFEEAYSAFVHQDRMRGFFIDKRYIKPNTAITEPSPLQHGTIFDWWQIIENVNQIHCICSSFCLFIDSIHLPKNPELFLHAYARPGEPLPKFNKSWEIIK
jgi:hypothetical protein